MPTPPPTATDGVDRTKSARSLAWVRSIASWSSKVGQDADDDDLLECGFGGGVDDLLGHRWLGDQRQGCRRQRAAKRGHIAEFSNSRRKPSHHIVEKIVNINSSFGGEDAASQKQAIVGRTHAKVIIEIYSTESKARQMWRSVVRLDPSKVEFLPKVSGSYVETTD